MIYKRDFVCLISLPPHNCENYSDWNYNLQPDSSALNNILLPFSIEIIEYSLRILHVWDIKSFIYTCITRFHDRL